MPAGRDGNGDLYKKIVWRLIPFLCFCYLAAYLDRINVGFAKLQMLDHLQWSETAYGLGAGLFFLGYILFEVPSNLILERVGAKLWIPVVHLEAGLRSGDRGMPEEVNRIVADRVTRWHFAPTEGSRANLLAEGHDDSRIFVTGNTGIDALRWASTLDVRFANVAMQELHDSDRRVIEWFRKHLQ